MSVFSDLLKNYIHEKKIKVMALAQYCDLERSTVYKFINGKREPMSAELVEQMAYFMKLTPSETYQLKESWKMARMGDDAYYICKSIEHFLSDFPNRSSQPSYNLATSAPDLKEDFSPTQNCLLLNSRQAIDSSVHQILLSEAAKPNGKIALFLQPDYPFLLHLLSTIQPEACILPFLRRDLLEDIFNYDIPGADSVISMADTLFNNNMQLINDEKFIIYFTEYGMTRFLQEGLFEEIPQTFYHPLNIAQRIRILREIAQCCHNGSYRILKKPLNHLSENLRMCLCGNTCSLTYQTNSGDHMCFAITGPFILQIFQEFLTNMDPDVYYKPEEAEQIIYRMIEQLEAK